jgi:extradiol dioxygenase family protein
MKRVMLQNSPLYAYIPVKDVGRARRFYEGKLGFGRGHHREVEELRQRGVKFEEGHILALVQDNS